VLFVVRELVPGIAEHLDAIVEVWIVRGGYHHTGDERPGAGQVGDARRGDDTGETYADALLLEAARNLTRQPGAGLARIDADQNFGTGIMPFSIGSQRHAYRMNRYGIERIFTGYAANTVGPE
jgi:hypothetical protein